VLALYSFTIFGYLTATLATYFIGRDAENDAGEIAGEKSFAAIQSSIASLEVGLADLRKELQALSRRMEK
jgi:voltage-gated potassium channel